MFHYNSILSAFPWVRGLELPLGGRSSEVAAWDLRFNRENLTDSWLTFQGPWLVPASFAPLYTSTLKRIPDTQPQREPAISPCCGADRKLLLRDTSDKKRRGFRIVISPATTATSNYSRFPRVPPSRPRRA